MPAASFQPQTIDLSASFVQLIRTALSFPKVTLDKTGLKSYDANGDLVLAINADGTAQLAGAVNAQGVILPIGGASPSLINSVAWHDAGGSQSGLIESFQDTPGSYELLVSENGLAGGAATINLQAALLSAIGNQSLAAIHIYSTPDNGPDPSTAVVAEARDKTGNDYSAILLDATGASSFLQLLSAQNLHLTVGQQNLTWPSSQTATPVNVTHGLGGTPQIVLATIATSLTGTVAHAMAYAYNATTFTLGAFASISNGNTIPFAWAAIG